MDDELGESEELLAQFEAAESLLVALVALFDERHQLLVWIRLLLEDLLMSNLHLGGEELLRELGGLLALLLRLGDAFFELVGKEILRVVEKEHGLELLEAVCEVDGGCLLLELFDFGFLVLVELADLEELDGDLLFELLLVRPKSRILSLELLELLTDLRVFLLEAGFFHLVACLQDFKVVVHHLLPKAAFVVELAKVQLFLYGAPLISGGEGEGLLELVDEHLFIDQFALHLRDHIFELDALLVFDLDVMFERT